MTVANPLEAIQAGGPLVLGLLAALHPCPLATQTASLLAVCGWDSSPAPYRWRGLALAAGAGCAYALLGGLLGLGLRQLPMLILPDVCRAFRPAGLLVTGILMTGVLARTRSPRREPTWRNAAPTRPRSLAAPFLLGAVTALTFCPATAGLFFGVLLPAATAGNSPVLDAVLFGVGSGIPLLIAVFTLASGLRLATVKPLAEKLARGAGWVLIALGAFLTLSLL